MMKKYKSLRPILKSLMRFSIATLIIVLSLYVVFNWLELYTKIHDTIIWSNYQQIYSTTIPRWDEGTKVGGRGLDNAPSVHYFNNNLLIIDTYLDVGGERLVNIKTIKGKDILSIESYDYILTNNGIYYFADDLPDVGILGNTAPEGGPYPNVLSLYYLPLDNIDTDVQPILITPLKFSTASYFRSTVKHIDDRDLIMTQSYTSSVFEDTSFTARIISTPHAYSDSTYSEIFEIHLDQIQSHNPTSTLNNLDYYIDDFDVLDDNLILFLEDNTILSSIDQSNLYTKFKTINIDITNHSSVTENYLYDISHTIDPNDKHILTTYYRSDYHSNPIKVIAKNKLIDIVDDKLSEERIFITDLINTVNDDNYQLHYLSGEIPFLRTVKSILDEEIYIINENGIITKIGEYPIDSNGDILTYNIANINGNYELYIIKQNANYNETQYSREIYYEIYKMK